MFLFVGVGQLDSILLLVCDEAKLGLYRVAYHITLVIDFIIHSVLLSHLFQLALK